MLGGDIGMGMYRKGMTKHVPGRRSWEINGVTRHMKRTKQMELVDCDLGGWTRFTIVATPGGVPL
jgi:hypothetical protein